MEKESIFLLNPPSGHPILRDYYCCTYSKTGYLWHPVDLLVQSGTLARSFDVTVFDAVARRAGAAEVLKELDACGARTVFSLVGSKSRREDAVLLSTIKEKTGARIAVSGDLVLSGSKNLFQDWPWLDAAVTDFISCDLSQFANGVPGALPGMVRRETDGVVHDPAPANTEFKYDIPLHDQFISEHYTMPYARAPFATVLTEYGCPFRCAFCNSGADSIGFRRRNIDNVKEELAAIMAMGVQHIFFKDMTFGTDRARSRALCEFMVGNLPGVTWHAYTRAHLLDEETAGLYASSGCTLLQIGVETASPDVAEAMRKKQSTGDLKKVFQLLKRHSIASGSHYILGLPGEDAAKTLKTIRLSLRLGADYASFNFFTPRPGSELYDKTPAARKNRTLWRFMMRLAYILFYFRPGYVLGKLASAEQRKSGGLKNLMYLAGYLRRLPDL